MAERAAHLVDHVCPDVPVRQWVLSMPYRLRYRLAWDHDLCRAVVAAYLRAVLGWLRRRARGDGVRDGRGGAVAIVQRFGGALNLNVHVHALVVDGVFARDAAGDLAFHSRPLLTALDVAEVLATVEPGITRVLERRGLGDRDEKGGAPDEWADEAPVLAGFAAASVGGTVALGRPRGARLARLGEAPEDERDAGPAVARCHAQANGFDWHAGLVGRAKQRDRLERLCRYARRPPVAGDRLHVTGTGQVRLQLRHRWADGTTHLVFEPLECLGRLAVRVPRPRVNLILYYGVLGARAAWRREVVPCERSVAEDDAEATEGSDADADTPDAARRRARGQCWAALMPRTCALDVLACPRCGGRLRLVALIDQGAVIGRILRHRGLPTAVPTPRPARAPPRPAGLAARCDDAVSVFDSWS